MIPLYYSVFIYLFPAMYGHNTWIGKGLYLLTPVAVLNHAKNDQEYIGKSIVRLIDRVFSHIFGLLMCVDMIANHGFARLYAQVFYVALIYSLMVFHVWKPLQKIRFLAQLLHVSMHAVSSIGICSYIAVACLGNEPRGRLNLVTKTIH